MTIILSINLFCSQVNRNKRKLSFVTVSGKCQSKFMSQNTVKFAPDTGGMMGADISTAELPKFVKRIRKSGNKKTAVDF